MKEIIINSEIKKIKWWIWFYFWMLIFEGALRKWILPQASDILLIVRDPIALWIYFLAYRSNKFTSSGVIHLIFFVAFLMFLGGLLNGVADDHLLTVNLFGLRTNFLHLFLLFVIPKFFDYHDVKTLGKWILIISMPMAFLMAIQFLSPADAYINKTVGLEGGRQIYAALGKIRPPGVFSFITGPASFYPLVMAFLLHGLVQKKTYPLWLLISSGFSLAIALAVSGSRITLLSVCIVAASLLVIAILRQEFITKSIWVVLVGTFIGLGLSSVPIFLEGTSVFATRIENASESESRGGGLLTRILTSFTDAFLDLEDLPFFGHGLGLGTNVGAALSGSRGQYLLAEGEWQRVVLESGILLGTIYILLRIFIILNLTQYALKKLSSGNTLPFLLLSACASLLLNGQFGQPTILGFAVLGAGLCLASGQTATEYQQVDENITRR
jgi:hypothetical protein